MSEHRYVLFKQKTYLT